MTIVIPVIKRKCVKHPSFDPAKGGRGAIKGGCRACEFLCSLLDQAEALKKLARQAADNTVTPRRLSPRPLPLNQQQRTIFELGGG